MTKKKRAKTTNKAKTASRKKTAKPKTLTKKIKKATVKPKRAKAIPKAKRATKRNSNAKIKHAASSRLSGKAGLEYDIKEEIRRESADIFTQSGKMTWSKWVVRYSPVLITMIVGLSTYFFLVFYLFYPQTIMYGHYMQLLMLLMFIFFVVGVFIYLGMQAELMFIRIMSFAFVFIIFTLLLIFILLAHGMYG